MRQVAPQTREDAAFPRMETGVGSIRLDEAAAAMLEEIKKNIDLGTSPRETVLLGFTVKSSQSSERVVEETFTISFLAKNCRTETENTKNSPISVAICAILSY